MLHPALSRALATAHIEDLHRATTADRVATDTHQPRARSNLKVGVLERPRNAIARLAGHRGTAP